MSWDEIKARWQAHLGKLARHWDRISERELDAIAGDRDRLSRRIQAVYGISAQEADRQIHDWEKQVTHARRDADDPRYATHGNPVPDKQANGHGYMDDEEQREMSETAPVGTGSSQKPSGMDRRD